jgi:ubiquinone/menaquinone biosynthesis C-methylase UbiE
VTLVRDSPQTILPVPIDPTSWDRGCERDPARVFFVVPSISHVIDSHNVKRAIDVGCGTGFLARKVESTAKPTQWTLLDRDADVLDYAQRVWQSTNTPILVNSTAEELVGSGNYSSYDLAVIAYTMLEVADLDAFVSAVKSLVPKGVIAAYLPEPPACIASNDMAVQFVEGRVNGGADFMKVDKINRFTQRKQTYLMRHMYRYIDAFLDDCTSLTSIESYICPRGRVHFGLIFCRREY